MPLNQQELANAIKQIGEEKNIPHEAIIETIEMALAAAFRKDFGEKDQNIKVEFDSETGSSRIFDVKDVVEDIAEEELEAMQQRRENEKEARERGEQVELLTEEEEQKMFNPKKQVMISSAKKINKKIKVGEILTQELFAEGDYGRMAAQTAKQVVIQRLRETEREMIFNSYKDKEGEMLSGTVQRVEPRAIYVDLGDSMAIMPISEQVENEKYRIGQRLKIYLVSVELGSKGPEIIVSRARPEIVKELFMTEVPEINNGSVELKAVAREAGRRSKIAVMTNEDSIDPVGSCVGQRGTRVQTIINELGGEKIDIIEWSEKVEKFISNALAPAKVLNVKLDEDNRIALAEVASDQLSLAIGKAGQNVRLAAKLTGWKIDIKGHEEESVKEEKKSDAVIEEKSEKEVEKKEEKKEDIKEDSGIKKEVKKKKAKIKKKEDDQANKEKDEK